MILRAATVADLSALGDLHVVIWRAAYVGLMPQPFLDHLTSEYFQEYWSRALVKPDLHPLVAEENCALIGAAIGGPSRDADAVPPHTGELQSVHVHPGHWRGHIGRRMCQELLQRLTRDRFTEATVWAFRDSARARRFYESLGFQLDGEHTKIANDGWSPAVRYRRRLDVNETAPTPDEVAPTRASSHVG